MLCTCPANEADDHRCPIKARLQDQHQVLQPGSKPYMNGGVLQIVASAHVNTQLWVLQLPDEESRYEEHCSGQSHRGQWHSASTPTTNKQLHAL